MALFKILRGESSSFTTDLQSINVYPEFHDGYCYFTADTGLFYIDYDDGSETTYNQFSGADVGYQLTEGKAYYLFDGNAYSLYEGNYNLLIEYGDPSVMPYFYYKTDGKRRIPLNAKQAEEFLGYSIENVLNDSEVEIPTSSAVFQALKKDWNQNDETATDYIHNRTHYKESNKTPLTFPVDHYGRGPFVNENIEVIFEDGYTYMEPLMGGHTENPTPLFYPGHTYYVIWDGIEYECIPQIPSINIGWEDHWVYMCLGNNDGSYPFCFLQIERAINGEYMGQPAEIYAYENGVELETGTTTHIISIYEIIEEVHPLDYQYVTAITEVNKGLEQKIWRGLKEEYDAIEEKDDNTLYIVTDEFEYAEKTFMDKNIYDPQNKQVDIYEYADNTHKTPKSGFILTDIVNGFNYAIQMVNGNLVSKLCIKSLEVTKMPNKTSYIQYELFDPTGMIVEVTYENGTVEEISSYQYNRGVDKADFSIYYDQVAIVEDIIQLEVEPFNPEEVLIDFYYIDNGDGTYTITEWKHTLNGVPNETDMVVPNFTNIIFQ